MEGMVTMDFGCYKGAKVFVTGHTGFKGSWLCEWLLSIGAEVYGYSLKPPTSPSLFNQLRLSKRIASHVIGDVRDSKALARAVKSAQPDFIFHLAAQPIVRYSYAHPAETFDTNVMGTVNLLESCRKLKNPCAVVCVTTDKVYENDDSGKAFSENDPLGGSDPYSASKGACEIAIQSYRRSFFSSPDSLVRVASARAGNVVGGGDWAQDRLIPDAMRAFFGDRRLVIRNRHSTRPWQHVLEPLSGYLMLGAAMAKNAEFATSFNFGPDPKSVKTVWDLMLNLLPLFPEVELEDLTDPDAPHEAKLLTLDSSKAERMLGWKSGWSFKRTIWETAEWYKGRYMHDSAVELCRKQIMSYQSDLKSGA
jgi:CDP-glucose 4,6-dehydratase